MDDRQAADEAALLEFLGAHGIAWTRHAHPQLFTVEESRALRGELPGAHTKNLFMLDRTRQPWLATCLEHRRVRIKDLERAAGARGLSFGKPEALLDVLGVTPGAVTPLGLFNDRHARRVTLVLDAQMMAMDPINVHPLHNEATLAIPRAHLAAFFAATGHVPVMVDFDALERQAEAFYAAEGAAR